MNPNDLDRFWKLWDDVGGLNNFTISQLRGLNATELPEYITQFQHGYCGLSYPLDVPVIAIPLKELLKKRPDGSYGPKFTSAAALRAHYKIGAQTKILLIGVSLDGPIEQFWAEHRKHGVPQALAKLGLMGVTTPNFSFFTDVPRFQIMRNRKRILLTAERLSNAGVPVAPHLNANTDADWMFWLTFLSDHPEIAVVTVEFQTGCKTDHASEELLNRLITLQNNLNRPLHPIMVGGGQLLLAARQSFNSFSVVDSRPFMETVHRQKLEKNTAGEYVWRKTPTAPGEPLDDLLRHNLEAHIAKLSSPIVASTLTPFELPELSISMPYLIAHPAA
jgi:hypothetical protein